MKRKTRFTSKKTSPAASVFTKVVSVIKIIKIELLIAILGLLLTLGQYFQHSITARINITRTWKEGYSSEIRDRVTRFRYFYKNWKDMAGEKRAKESLEMIISPKELFGCGKDHNPFVNEDCENSSNLFNDEFIKKLIANEIEAIKTKNQAKEPPNQANEPTRVEKIEIILKYRNAIIECLNTAEAVKAVIQSKPLPFRITIFYRDTLEGRYRDIIEELKIDLIDFMEVYRDILPPRETEAWYVLTSDESDLNDLVNVILYFLIFSSVLTLIYLIKIRMQKRGLLPEKAK